jgi:branched-chain amino acid transport system permease protein
VFINDRVDALWNLRLAYLAMYAIALSGMVVLVGHSGQVSLGNGAFMAVGGYAFALAFMHGYSIPVAMLLAGLMGLFFGALVGLVAARLSGPYLAGLTLGLAVGLPALANRFPDLLGGDSGLLLDGPYPPESYGMDFPIERWQAWIAGATAVVVFAIVAWLIAAPFGRSVRATRDHEPAAALAGINTAATKIAAFAVSAGCAALAGAVLTQILGLAAPGAFSIGLSLSLLVGTVVGGRQRLLGAFLGAAMLALLPELISNWVTTRELPDRIGLNLPGLVYGGLLLLTVGLAPGGLANISRTRRR